MRDGTVRVGGAGPADRTQQGSDETGMAPAADYQQVGVAAQTDQAVHRIALHRNGFVVKRGFTVEGGEHTQHHQLLRRVVRMGGSGWRHAVAQWLPGGDRREPGAHQHGHRTAEPQRLDGRR